MLETVLLTIAAFASTNVDHALVLLAFFGDQRFRSRDVVIGQYAGMTVITIAAMALALVTYLIPYRYVGWMGLLPILVGILLPWQAWRARNKPQAAEIKLRAWGSVGAVAGVAIANGGDNVAVFVPLFAKTSMPGTLTICSVFAVMVAMTGAAAHFLVRHRALTFVVRKWGRRVTPLVLIALGSYILVRSGALTALHS